MVVAVALIVGVWLRVLGPSWAPHSERPDDVAAVDELAPSEVGALQPPEIAPPDPALLELRRVLPQRAKRANADDLAAMTAYYDKRKSQLVWVTQDGYSKRAIAAIAELRRAGDWGLRAADFTVPDLPGEALSPEAAAEAEITLTLALLKYARHARGGRIPDPSRISKLLDQSPPIRPPNLVLADLEAAAAPDAYLRSLHPKHDQFVKLQRLLVKLRHSGQSKSAPRPAQAGIDFGARLNEAALVSEEPGKPTRALSPRVAADIDRIIVNMERWRWLPVDLGSFYVWNNVPEFLTRVVKSGKIVNSDRIVAGQPAWPTPAFSADMKTIVFHPSWGVPDGIKRKELAPLLRKSTGGGLMGLFTGAPSSRDVLDAHNLRVYRDGREIDPNQVDWGSANIAAYDFRQPPGPRNVLGAIKFMFPNKHDVYMHDTPERGLFERSFRGLSHGCMRVGDPRRLAEVLLGEDKGWSQEKVASLFRGGSQSVELTSHIPVHMTYFTAMVDYQGNLRTFGDLYGLDARVGKALLGRDVRFKTRSYDTEVAAILREQREKERQQRARQSQASASGPSSLVDAISDIFSP